MVGVARGGFHGRPRTRFCSIIPLAAAWVTLVRVGLRDGKFFFRRETDKCNGLPESPLPGQHHGIAPGRRDHRQMPGITMPGYIETGGRNMRTDSSSTIGRLTPRSQPDRTGWEAYPAAMLYPTDTSCYSARSPIEAQFAPWASGNVTLRRLYAIT